MEKLSNKLGEHIGVFGIAGLSLVGGLVLSLTRVEPDYASVSLTSAPKLVRMSKGETGERRLQVKKGDSFFVHCYSKDKDGIKETRVYVDETELRKVNNGTLAKEIGKHPQVFYTPAGGWKYETSSMGTGEHPIRYEVEDSKGRISQDISKLVVE